MAKMQTNFNFEIGVSFCQILVMQLRFSGPASAPAFPFAPHSSWLPVRLRLGFCHSMVRQQDGSTKQQTPSLQIYFLFLVCTNAKNKLGKAGSRGSISNSVKLSGFKKEEEAAKRGKQAANTLEKYLGFVF